MGKLKPTYFFVLCFTICCFLTTGFNGEVRASPVVVPLGLAPGDSYRLAFVTSDERDALSGDIADYNAFVTAAAMAVPELAALGTTWRAIGSTSDIHARDNTNTNPFVDGVGVPIYSLDGIDLIAANNSDLWDGVIVTAIRETENGVIENNTGIVWTGSWFDGTAFAAGLLGDADSVVGLSPFFHSAAWIASEVRTSSESYHLYAISDVLVAPATQVSVVPSVLLLASGFLALRLNQKARR